MLKARCFNCGEWSDDCYELEDDQGSRVVCMECCLDLTDDAKEVTFLWPGGGLVMTTVEPSVGAD